MVIIFIIMSVPFTTYKGRIKVIIYYYCTVLHCTAKADGKNVNENNNNENVTKN